MILRGLIVVFIVFGMQNIQAEVLNHIQENLQLSIKSIEILDKGTELIFTSPVDLNENDKITLSSKVDQDSKNYVATVPVDVVAGGDVAVVFDDLELQLPINTVTFVIIVKGNSGTLSLTGVTVSESKINTVGVAKQSVRFRLSPDDALKDTSISTCTKGSLCYLIEAKTNDIKERYSVCQFLQPSTLGRQSDEVRFCQPVQTKTYNEGAVDVSSIELILEVSVVLESQFADGEHVEVVSYSSAEPHDQFTTTPYDCTIEGASCSLPIKPTEGRDLTHLVVVKNKDGEVIKSSTFDFINPKIKQKTNDRIMIDMISKTSHDVAVTLDNEKPFNLHCDAEDDICTVYLKASKDAQISVSETIESCLQTVIASLPMKEISNFDKEIEVSRSDDNRIKACFSPSSPANKYELAIVKDNILKDINTETIVEGDKTCALSASVLLSGYVDLDVIISAFDEEDTLLIGAEWNWKTISLVPYNHVYLVLKDKENKIYKASWILLERTENIANYSITVNSEDTADIQSLAVPASRNGVEMSLESLQKYSVCVQALSSDPSVNSEIVCSHLGTLPDDSQIPITKDVKLYSTATNVIVTWDPNPTNMTAYYIYWTKKRQFVHPTQLRFLKSEENNFSIVPSSHNKIELPISSGTANDVCVCGVQDGVIATLCGCPSTPTDSKPPPDVPTQLNFDSATKDFSWAKVDGADTYVVEFEKEDLIHSEAVTDTKINVETIELEAGKWTMKVRAEKEGFVSSAAAIPQSIVNGIRILATQKSASELEVTWNEYPQVQDPQDYKIKVDEEEKTVKCGVHTSCKATFNGLSCDSAVTIGVSRDVTMLSKKLDLKCIDVPSGLKSKKSSLNYKITWDSVPEASSYLLEHLNGDELLLQKEIHYTKYEFDGENLLGHHIQVRSCKDTFCGNPTNIRIKGNNDDDGVDAWVIVVSTLGAVVGVAAIIGGIYFARLKSKKKKRFSTSE